MARVNGNNLRLWALNAATGDRIQFAHSQSVSLDISNSLIDITTKDSNSWMEKLSGQKSFSLSADGVLDYDVTATTAHDTIVLADYAILGSEIFFDFGIDGGTATDPVYRGSGFITSLSQSGGTDEAPAYSISIDGNGALAKATIA